MATVTIMAALGGFGGPWAYKGSQATQGYPDGQIATLSLMSASVLAYVLLWYVSSDRRNLLHLLNTYAVSSGH